MRVHSAATGGRDKKLSRGVWLELRHPAHAALPCSDCQKWWYLPDATVTTRGGANGVKLPMLRPPGMATPCAVCPKIPAGEPVKVAANAVELSETNRTAWAHYQECRAVGAFPDDPLVRHHARLIREVYDTVDGDQQRTLMMLLAGNLQKR